jgi:hypothetical protein
VKTSNTRYTDNETGKQKRPSIRYASDFLPDMIDHVTPNYEKYERMGFTAERTLALLNID